MDYVCLVHVPGSCTFQHAPLQSHDMLKVQEPQSNAPYRRVTLGVPPGKAVVSRVGACEATP